MAVLAGLLAAAVHWGPPASRRARLLYWQRECLNYTAPSDQVVYDQDTARAAGLLKQPGYHQDTSGDVYSIPRCWEHIAKLAGPAGSTGAVLFLHERQSPNGQRRLVVLQLPADTGPVLGLLEPLLIEPATLTTPSKIHLVTLSTQLDGAWLPLHSVRYFAGQADLNDRSHFAVRCENDGSAMTIDGWLENDNHLRLKIHGTPTAESDGPRITGNFGITAKGLTITNLRINGESDPSRSAFRFNSWIPGMRQANGVLTITTLATQPSTHSSTQPAK